MKCDRCDKEIGDDYRMLGEDAYFMKCCETCCDFWEVLVDEAFHMFTNNNLLNNNKAGDDNEKR